MADRPKTPWAVRCRTHGQVFLTQAEYEYQMERPNRVWTCPICNDDAGWDDENYERSMR